MNGAGKRNDTFRICFIGLMAAIAFVANYIRFPLLGSQVHMGNAVCVLCGLFFGPGAGFLAAGIGNLFFDLFTGYGVESLVTFVMKGTVALLAALIGGKAARETRQSTRSQALVLVACIAGAASYVVLYMLKTFIFGLTVYGLTIEATLVKMGSKLPASLINAVFAAVASPVLMNAVRSPLRQIGVFEKMK